MKLALVNNNYVLGGAETVVRQLHEGVLAGGHRSELWISDFKHAPKQQGVRTLYPPLFARLLHTRLRTAVNRCFPKNQWTDRRFRALGDGRADLVHMHAFHGIYARLDSVAELARRVPLVWTFHRFWGITGGCDHPGTCTRYLDACGSCPRVEEWPMNGTDNTARQLAEKRALLAHLPITVIAPSRHMLRTIRESPIGRNWRSHYIPNGVDLARFDRAANGETSPLASLGLPANRKLVLVVNRDFKDPVKGYGIIRDALSRLSKRLSGFVIGFVGWHADWACAQLPEQVPTVPIGFVGDRDRLARLYGAAEIFLYASPGENFPCAIIEAMAAECCIVSTPTDGVLEQIEDGQTGLIARDFSGAGLAVRLEEALGDPALRARLGAAARVRATDEFSESVMIERHLKLYAELLEESR